jgi:hypothetical protein
MHRRRMGWVFPAAVAGVAGGGGGRCRRWWRVFPAAVAGVAGGGGGCCRRRWRCGGGRVRPCVGDGRRAARHRSRDTIRSTRPPPQSQETSLVAGSPDPCSMWPLAGSSGAASQAQLPRHHSLNATATAVAGNQPRRGKPGSGAEFTPRAIAITPNRAGSTQRRPRRRVLPTAMAGVADGDGGCRRRWRVLRAAVALWARARAAAGRRWAPSQPATVPATPFV